MMHFTRVDFPAPLSPTMARISPAMAARDASASATTCPNAFHAPSRESTDARSAAGTVGLSSDVAVSPASSTGRLAYPPHPVTPP